MGVKTWVGRLEISPRVMVAVKVRERGKTNTYSWVWPEKKLWRGEHGKKIIDDIIGEFDVYANINPILNNIEIKHDIEKINGDMKLINDYITEVKTTLDKAVH